MARSARRYGRGRKENGSARRSRFLPRLATTYDGAAARGGELRAASTAYSVTKLSPYCSRIGFTGWNHVVAVNWPQL